VADDTICNEVTGAGGDVVQAVATPERLDLGDAELGRVLEGHRLDLALARDRGIHGMEEAQFLT
jgi:hypothetical protein